MLGAIIGDIAGSRFEWNNYKKKDGYHLLAEKCRPTDDSIMSLAVARAILDSQPDYSDLSGLAVQRMQTIGRKYPDCGFGGRFYDWVFSDEPQPYNSYGNGAAMRVSPAGFAAASLDEAKLIARTVTAVTHNHPESLKAAEAVAVAIFLVRQGCSKQELRDVITREYYPLDFTLDEIRPTYKFDVSCQGSVPQALEAFFEATDFEDAIRNAISIGGDSDTIASICGGIAGVYYGIPAGLREQALGYLDEYLLQIYTDFENKYTRA